MKKLSTFSGRLGLAALLGLSATAAWAVDPVNISNEAELRAIANNLAGEYTLTADITVTSDWTPLGDNDHPFTGKLYGNGHVIKGIRVQDPDHNEKAFIGAIKDATITKLGLENVDILGNQNAGGLVGLDKGNNTISECYVTGKVEGRDHVGALIGGCGDALTRIENCYGITYSYSREHQAAGLVGTPVNLVIDKCYFGGTILGVKNCVGGIAALVDGGVQHDITNCFVAAPMMIRINTDMGDQHRVLGKTGGEKKNKLENDYALAGSWTGPYFAHSIIKSDNANSTDGADKSFDELTDPTFITGTLGWSADVWTAEAGVLPRLKWQKDPVDVSKVFAIHAGDVVTVAPGATKQAKVGTLYGAKYSSSDESIVTVDQEGTVTGVKDGTATITVKIPGNNTVKEASTTFTVIVKEVLNTVKLDGTGKLRCFIHSASGHVNDGEHEFYLNTREETPGKKWCENQSPNPWVIWEFTDYYNINGFWFEDAKYYEPGSQNTPDWKLEYSSDCKNWTEILHMDNDGERTFKYESFKPVEVRYLRATFKKADGAVRIYGVDILGEYSRPIERKNNLISVGKTILKSYDAANMRETASNLINGYADSSHKWCFYKASVNDPIKFAVIDLEDTYDIEKIELVDCKAGGETTEPNLQDLNIYVSNTAPDLDLITPQGDTNTCWNLVASATGAGNQNTKTYTFKSKSESDPEAKPKEVKAKAETAPVRARYVKLEVPFFIGETPTNNTFTARVPALNVYGTKYVVGTGVGGIDADDAAISVRTAAGAAVVEASDATVYVYDLAGRLISKKSVNGTAAIELPASIYLVRVVTPAGSKVAKVAIR